MAVSADQTLMGDAAPSSKLSMLKFDEASGGAAAKPKIVEVGEDGAFDMEAAAAAAEPEPEAEEEEASLMDLMMADASTDRTARAAKRKEEDKRMKKSFGDGMKKGLKKGFFDAKPKAKKRAPAKPRAPAEPAGPVTISARPPADDGASVRSAIRQEVAANMEGSSHPMAQALKGGDWVTPELVKAMAERPALARGMGDPRCQAALEELRRDPKAGAKKFDDDPELKQFLTDFCEVMGGHFEKLGAAAPPPPPTADEKEQLGPLAAKVVEDAAKGQGPAPAKTPEEIKQVDDVLNNAALRDLLMDPKTQLLMQRCADPREFQRAMMNPDERAIIRKLADAGLVKLES